LTSGSEFNRREQRKRRNSRQFHQASRCSIGINDQLPQTEAGRRSFKCHRSRYESGLARESRRGNRGSSHSVSSVRSCSKCGQAAVKSNLVRESDVARFPRGPSAPRAAGCDCRGAGHAGRRPPMLPRSWLSRTAVGEYPLCDLLTPERDWAMWARSFSELETNGGRASNSEFVILGARRFRRRTRQSGSIA